MSYNKETQPFMGDNGYGNQHQQWQGGAEDVYQDAHNQPPTDKNGYDRSQIRHRAALGWGSAFIGCVALEITGTMGFYDRGLTFAAACQGVVLIFVLVMTNLFFSWKPADRHRQNWLLNLAFSLGIMFGLLGGQLGGFYFSRWGDLNARIDYKGVSPDISPLNLINPGKIQFEKGTLLRGLQMGSAQFTSSNRLENRFRWYACATPIVSTTTTDTVHYWAITEGISPCTAPENFCAAGKSCIGYVLTDTGHAASAVDAARRQHGLRELPGAAFISIGIEPAEYTDATLNKALISILAPILLFPLFTFIIYYIITVYEAVYFTWFTGAQFAKYQHSN